jgi:hypothetical protein
MSSINFSSRKASSVPWAAVFCSSQVRITLPLFVYSPFTASKFAIPWRRCTTILTPIPALGAVGQYFTTHRALALGIVVSGSSIGGIILPIMVERLIPQISFGWAMRSVAFLLLGLLAIGNVFVKARLPPPKKRFQITEFLAPFKEVPFALLTASSFFIYLGGFLPFTFVIVQARKEGMSVALAGYLVSILNGAS